MIAPFASRLSTKMLSSSFWNTEETLEERRKKIKDKIDPIFSRLKEDAAKTKEWIEKAQAHRSILHAALNDGLDLFVELDENGNSRKLFLNKK